MGHKQTEIMDINKKNLQKLFDELNPKMNKIIYCACDKLKLIRQESCVRGRIDIYECPQCKRYHYKLIR